MPTRTTLSLLFGTLILMACPWSQRAPACCLAPPPGKPAVNADQAVIIIWDRATRTEHFIRKASFKSEADDFGFIVPTPTQPELQESGDEAFPLLAKLTAPEIKTRWHPSCPIGCSTSMPCGEPPGVHTLDVQVLQEKEVAGYKAVVLQAGSSNDLLDWLKENGYDFSPAVAEWARPYVEEGWKFTALKLAKHDGDKQQQGLAASSLRISFTTERPLFPYREPDSTAFARALGVDRRLLRIYFIADARYRGELTREAPWTGKVVWSKKVGSESRKQVLDLLKLPERTGPADWWLTEFEDNWPYHIAPADLYFYRDSNQKTMVRDPIVAYAPPPWPSDVAVYAIAGILVVPLLIRRLRRSKAWGVRSGA